MGVTADISRAQERRLAFLAQFRCNGPLPGPRASLPVRTAAANLSRIGYAQIDTISVVERAHHHVFWSRDDAYRPPALAALEAEPRAAFEYWAHAAAYLPMEDYRFCLPRMRRIASEGHEWFPSDARVVDWVRDRIRAEGPLRSQDFESQGARGPWWDWKPAKAALEFLFQSGQLMVVSRPGFQKLYDLSERALPPSVDRTYPADAEMADWYVRRAALALGAFAERDVAYMRKDATGGIRAALGRAVDRGRLVPVTVDGQARPARWACVDVMGLSSSRAAGLPAGRPARILSPFDNLIIDRRRCKRVFGLDYTLECYVPQPKRAFGYFALPLFWKGAPVGLLDCKAERRDGVLRVRRAEFRFAALKGRDYGEGEPYAPGGLADAEATRRAPAGFRDAVVRELNAFASFNGCGELRFDGLIAD